MKKLLDRIRLAVRTWLAWRRTLIAEVTKLRRDNYALMAAAAKDREAAAKAEETARSLSGVAEILRREVEGLRARLRDEVSAGAVLDETRAILGCPHKKPTVEHAQDLMKVFRRVASAELIRAMLGGRKIDVLPKLEAMPIEERRAYVADAAIILEKKPFRDVIDEIFRELTEEAGLQAVDWDRSVYCRFEIAGATLVEKKLEELAEEHRQNIADAQRAGEKIEPGEIMPTP